METKVAVDDKRIPFGVGYAKSSRAFCKGCKSTIGEDSLRMSVREPSRFFDGMQDNWFHYTCFWKRLKPGKTEINERSIRGMDMLKWDDQEKIREKIQAFMNYSSGGPVMESSFSTVKVEYAKTNRGKCSRCKEIIPQKQIKFGLHSGWYHQQCLFVGKIVFGGHIDEMNGFCYLTEEDQEKLMEELKNFTVPYLDAEDEGMEEGAGDGKENVKEGKKRQCESDRGDEAPSKKQRKDSSGTSNTELLKKQSNLLWELQRDVKANLSKSEMVELLTRNHQKPHKKTEKVKKILIMRDHEVLTHLVQMIDLVVDCILFGRCLPCPKCGGQLIYSTSSRSYRCDGQISEYTKCTYHDQNPQREKFVIPKEMMAENKYLKKLKVNLLEKRVYNEAVANQTIVGQSDQFKYLGSRGMTSSEEKGDVDGKSIGVGSGMSRQLVKGGTIVDQECEYADVSHVHRSKNGVLYSVVLGSVDMETNRNSYYKLQLLKHDHKPTFYLFRSWGRVGTVIGGTRTETFRNEENAVEAFEQLFSEKSGNEWANKDNFKKLPGRMDLVDTDFTAVVNLLRCLFRTSPGTFFFKEEQEEPAIKPGSLSKLNPSIKDILLMIFDMEQMKTQMLGFQLDLDKMPLGKLSRKQITNAYSVLTELQTMMEKNLDTDKILDATNRFYTLIPHNFGMNKPTLLDSTDLIKQKCAMLDSLLEIQVAYQVIKDEVKEEGSEERDPVDMHYERLNCKMEVVDHDSPEFNTIKTYMANTHGATHTMFDLEIVDVIRVDRADEDKKFKADLGNRMLLWHGSGTANYGGILSQGLRIAPPEAPVTGYMFGKGVYFADMASKSANYCKVVTDGADGLLLLCDVALGKVKPELNAKEYTLKKLRGFNSVQGLGKTEPNPSEAIKSEEGYTIPLGKPVDANQDKDCSLLYNEYIVYDVNQIKLKYLVRTKFKMNLF
ncbi:Poly(ADP-ribose) polymerase catalytic domain protein [Ancylostoma caninum]|uniref:Poly [ADP-ribose] polymerase n=1 Tax=Ancylostoma caninum TaxID=29170 RepID=A0A368GNV1_ANCCA|nr:Poly(ADP-ribose) polymerase catalytic domain protein [Ancylostoma caninum]